jgi:hypothetical protein
VVTSARPLYDAADLLEGMYAKPVTYEDPKWMWNGDTTTSPVAKGLYVKKRTFTLPDAVFEGSADALDETLINRVIAANNSQTDGPRFRLLSSRWGFHIVPGQARDATGRFVEATSPLDDLIEVPVGTRTPTDHFHALCAALTAAAGIRVEPLSRDLDAYFAPQGIIPPRVATDSDLKRISYPWGSTNVTAREALISLLETSGTTMSWRLWCNPEPWDQYYILTLQPIMLLISDSTGHVTKKPLVYDRCKKCPPLLGPVIRPIKK